MTENETPQPDAQATPEEAPEVTAPATETGDDAESPKVSYRLVKTEHQEGSVNRYTVEVETQVFDEKMETIFHDLKKTVLIDGFRPGKAPVQLLKIRFGEEAQKDALNDLAENVAKQIVESESLQSVGDPSLADSKVEQGKPVEMQIDIEAMPQIDATGYTDNEIEVEVEPVTDETVDRQIEYIRDANATYETTKTTKKYAPGDGASLDLEVTDSEGKRMASLCRENAFMRDPQAALPSEVAKALVGKKVGDVVTQAVERTVKNRKGEEVTHKDTYAVTIKEIKERKVPELDDEFAKDVGDFATLADLRKRVRDDLTQQSEARKREQIMEKLFDRLIEANAFDAPKTIVAAQEYQTIVRDTNQMRAMGIDLAAMGMSTEGYLNSAKSNATRFVKVNLLVNAIAKKESIEVGDADVDKEIERRAEAEGRKPLAIRARLEAEKKLDSLRRSLVVDKVEDFLIARNKIHETVPAKKEPEAETPKTPRRKKKEA
ncbi:trigger factor [Candidatus Sumerlaeota bacterium]|nr:trigger factor [Candidatus Sumerlaeota bacterium]